MDNRSPEINSMELSSTARTSMTGPFQSAPVEVVDYILILTDPETISSVSQTSRTLHIYIRDNVFLWKSIFAKYFDLPEEHNQPTDWRSQVQSHTQVKHTILAPSSVHVSYTELRNTSKVLVQIIRSAPPGRGWSKNIAWVDGILTNPAIWPPHSPITFTHPQLSQHSQPHSELQVLECDRIGRPEDRLKARTYVYDMRNYHDAALKYHHCALRPDDSNLYGPFIVRGSLNEPFQTNYFHLRYILNVLLNNLRDSPSNDAHAWTEGGFENTRPMIAPPSPVDGDWAGVQGDWLRITSWLNYNDFKEYNVRHTIICVHGRALPNLHIVAAGRQTASPWRCTKLGPVSRSFLYRGHRILSNHHAHHIDRPTIHTPPDDETEYSFRRNQLRRRFTRSQNRGHSARPWGRRV